MAFKQFVLQDGTPITIYKRKASRSLRLSIGAGGQIRVSIPLWAPYKSGLEFARSRQTWIAAKRRPPIQLVPGQAVGKAHHLRFIASQTVSRPASRIRASEITITYPLSLRPDSPSVQKLAMAASLRALRAQAEQLLPGRLAELAARHGFSYASVSVKLLKSRWGSCDQQTNIVLNLFLMQLPWGCIDYVLVHELVHTKVMKHGPDFWQAMTLVLPNVKQLRSQMRDYQPVLDGSLPPAVA